jgi:hypothetical protein
MVRTRLPRLLHAVGLLIALVLPMAHANAESDPSGRVARMNYFSGTVTFAPSGSDDWVRIHVNRPLIAGDRIWVDRDGRSEVHVGSTALRLGAESSLSFLRLDDDTAQMKLTQGTLNLHVRALSSGQVYEVDTPNLAFSVQSPGTYRIDVAPDGGMTTITVRHGSGTAYGAASSTTMSAGQQVAFTGTDLQIASSVGSPSFDEFDIWANGRDQIEDTSMTARYVSRDVIGYEQLDAWGSWRDTPQYGAVWVPRVTVVGWAPYRTGHWDWIQPWGWTWIDDAPWGFAPYHYGRWAYLGHSWCWVPGRIVAVRPVYAPALVAFVGGHGSRFSLSLSFGGTVSPSVGWFPLGPGEIYRPAYVASPTYVRNVNKVIVNNTTINNTTVSKTVYVNQHAPNAITAVPVNVFTKGTSVTTVARPMAPHELKNLAAIDHEPHVAAPAHGFVGMAQHVEPPPARNTFERPVVVTSPAPGHKTVRAALAGREVATVERDEKSRERQPGASSNVIGNQHGQPAQPVPQPVPQSSPRLNSQPVLQAPSPARDRQVSSPHGDPRVEREIAPKPHEEVPRPPHDAVQRPVSHAEPHPAVPQHEQRVVPSAPSRIEPVMQAPVQQAPVQHVERPRHVDVPRAPEQHHEAAPKEVHERPQGEPHQEKHHVHEKKEGERASRAE